MQKMQNFKILDRVQEKTMTQKNGKLMQIANVPIAANQKHTLGSTSLTGAGVGVVAGAAAAMVSDK